jgi:hypothetical protein
MNRNDKETEHLMITNYWKSSTSANSSLAKWRVQC